jgi:L-lactate dehydrogenase complex protein LldG
MNAREEILGRIRIALADRAPAPEVFRDYHGATQTVVDDPVALFEHRLLDYKATVRRCSIADIPTVVAQSLRDRSRVVAPPGLPPEWLAGLSVRSNELPGDQFLGDDQLLSDEPELSIDELDRAGGVITGCATAIALTGTIVLDHGPGQGRRAVTLVPDYHLAVVLVDQIVNGVPDAIAVLDPNRPQTWISGPSATSDIELNRVEGVHGPRTLEVVIAG